MLKGKTLLGANLVNKSVYIKKITFKKAKIWRQVFELAVV
jgi:hypothetical protein